jgi:prepilin-type N-terminal cleavage/methylation domain-containing protein
MDILTFSLGLVIGLILVAIVATTLRILKAQKEELEASDAAQTGMHTGVSLQELKKPSTNEYVRRFPSSVQGFTLIEVITVLAMFSGLCFLAYTIIQKVF